MCKGVKHVIRYHTREINKYKNVVLIGHSIGCFFGLQVAKRVTNIDKIILLFPTIVHMEKTPGREHMDTIEPIYRFVAPMSDYFPKPLSNWLSNSEYGHNLFHKQIIMNCIGLWHEERIVVTNPNHHWFTQDKQDYFVIYSTKDDWTPPPVVRVLRRLFTNTVETDYSHSFVLHEVECKLVAGYIANYLCL